MVVGHGVVGDFSGDVFDRCYAGLLAAGSDDIRHKRKLTLIIHVQSEAIDNSLTGQNNGQEESLKPLRGHYHSTAPSRKERRVSERAGRTEQGRWRVSR